LIHDDIASLYAYNRWADRRVLDACRKLTPEQYAAEPVPGWSSVRSTIVHIAIVTEGWLRGVAGDEVTSVPTEDELSTVDAAERHLDLAYAHLDRILSTLTAEQMAAPREYRRGDRRAVLPPWAVLRHVVNHATYHRGQIASKLGRFGVEPTPTDMVYWAFEQFPQS
jgi:uncharacterized damage-inducible protein DinB